MCEPPNILSINSSACDSRNQYPFLATNSPDEERRELELGGGGRGRKADICTDKEKDQGSAGS